MGILDSLLNSVGNSVKREATGLASSAISSAKRNAATTVNKAVDKGVKKVTSELQKKEFKVVFKELPTTLAELQALPEASLKEPYYVVALVSAALLQYKDNREACIEMLDFLNGPNDVNNYTSAFLKERLEEKDYVARSFFEGSSPENNYTPTKPYTIKIYQTAASDAIDSNEYKRLFLQSSGSDMLREVRVRLKPSTKQWFLWEMYQLSDIRIPKKDDSWA